MMQGRRKTFNPSFKKRKTISKRNDQRETLQGPTPRIQPGSINDPRNFRSNAEKNAILKKLIALFKENNHFKQYSFKGLKKNTPATIDVYYIFEFLFRMLDPNFELKYEIVENSTYKGTKKEKKKISHSNIYEIIKLFNYQGKLKTGELKSLIPSSWNSCIFVFELFLELIEHHNSRNSKIYNENSGNKKKKTKKKKATDASDMIDEDEDEEDEEEDDMGFGSNDDDFENDKVYYNEHFADFKILKIGYPLFMNGEDNSLETFMATQLDSNQEKQESLESYNENLKEKLNNSKQIISNFSGKEKQIKKLKKKNRLLKKELKKLVKKHNDIENNNNKLEESKKQILPQLFEQENMYEEINKKEKLLREKITFQQMTKDEILKLKNENEQKINEYNRIKQLTQQNGDTYWKNGTELTVLKEKNNSLMVENNNTLNKLSSKVHFNQNFFIQTCDLDSINSSNAEMKNYLDQLNSKYAELERELNKIENKDPNAMDVDTEEEDFMGIELEENELEQKSLEYEREIENLKNELSDFKIKREKETEDMNMELKKTMKYIKSYKQKKEKIINKTHNEVKKIHDEIIMF